MFILFVALLAPFFSSFANIIECKLSNNIFKHPATMIFYISLMNCLFMPLLLFFGIPTLPAPGAVPFYFLLAFIDVAYLYPYYKAMKVIDTSIVSALFSLGQITIPIMTYLFLDERLRESQYAGFLLIIAASIVLSINDFKMPKLNRAFYYMVFVSLLRAFYVVLQKYTFKEDDNWINLIIYVNIFSFLLPFLLFLHKKSAERIRSTFAEYRKNTKVFCLNEFLCFLGGAAAVYALSKLSAVTSSAINATAPIFMLFISLALKKMFDIRVKRNDYAAHYDKKADMFCRNYCRRGHGGALIYRSLRLKRRCFRLSPKRFLWSFRQCLPAFFVFGQTGKALISSTDNAFMSADRRKKRR